MTGRGRERSPAPLRVLVWLLAAFYLGRVYYDNTLYDLRQLTTAEVVVRSAAIAVVATFLYWNVAVADAGLLALVYGVVAVFAGKVLLVLAVVRAGAAAVSRRDDYRQRRSERADDRRRRDRDEP